MAKFLLQPHKINEVKKILEDGHEFIFVSLSNEIGKMDYWFDPKVNYLVSKMRAEEKNAITEVKVNRFIECKPGIYFPGEVVGTEHQGNKLFRTRTVHFSEVHINDPLPEGVFNFRFPPRILVSDSIKREWHRTDGNGQPTLPGTNSQGQTMPLLKSPKLLENPEKKLEESTREEPRKWSDWILPVSLALFIGGGLLWICQRWLKNRKEQGMNG